MRQTFLKRRNTRRKNADKGFSISDYIRVPNFGAAGSGAGSGDLSDRQDLSGLEEPTYLITAFAVVLVTTIVSELYVHQWIANNSVDKSNSIGSISSRSSSSSSSSSAWSRESTPGSTTCVFSDKNMNQNIRGLLEILQDNKTEKLSISGTLTGLDQPGTHSVHLLGRGEQNSACSDLLDENMKGLLADISDFEDLGTLEADTDGNAVVKIKNSEAFFDGQNSILGKSIVIHRGTEGEGLQGDVAGCCIINIA